MSQDEIKTTGSCCSRTIIDLISGRTSGVFMYLLLRKTITSKWLNVCGFKLSLKPNLIWNRLSLSYVYNYFKTLKFKQKMTLSTCANSADEW